LTSNWLVVLFDDGRTARLKGKEQDKAIVL